MNLQSLIVELTRARKYYARLSIGKDVVGSHDYVLGLFEGFEAACQIVWRFIRNYPDRPSYRKPLHESTRRRLHI